MIPQILHTTISPCENERRIFNQAFTALKNSYSVKILALKTPDVPEVSLLGNIEIRRISINNWEGGKLKFINFNIKLFFILLKEKYTILHVHDLWVFPASALSAIFRGKPLIYDAHEFASGLEIFNTKRLSGWIWKLCERILIRRAEVIITINEQHKKLFLNKYRKIPLPYVIMNLPFRERNSIPNQMLDFSDRKNMVIYQGILKKGRGLKNTIKSIQSVNRGILGIIGHGELEYELRQLVSDLNLEEKVRFYGKISWDKLLSESQKAKAGIVLFEPLSENYKYAAPNKFFEYVMAGTPLIASKIPSFEYFISKFEVGLLVDPDSLDQISEAINKLLTDKFLWNRLHKNCLEAREIWNWETQEDKLIDIYNSFEYPIINYK
jgi:glycosyltransferase involved in cell wall biosynthesis